MEAIEYTSNNFVFTIERNHKPFLEIAKIIFISNDKKWVERLTNVSLSFKIVCYDINNNDIGSYSEKMFINPFISPYHKQPIFEIKKFVPEYDTFSDVHNGMKWKLSIELHDLILSEDEFLNVLYIDDLHIQKRVLDWQLRVSNLYIQLSEWILENPEVAINKGQPVIMYEELMQRFNVEPQKIDTADVVKSKRIIMSFIPKGLWVIGANGLVDIISNKGSFFIVDAAEQFEQPIWQIYSSSNKKNYRAFTKEEFFKLIS